MNMPGIGFLRDRKGRRKVVLIDLKKHKQLWEDLHDAYLAHSRRGERRESLATVKRLIGVRPRRVADYAVVFARSARTELPKP